MTRLRLISTAYLRATNLARIVSPLVAGMDKALLVGLGLVRELIGTEDERPYQGTTIVWKAVSGRTTPRRDPGSGR
jgi:hypothetical protein